jgi:hypothetical protein
MSVEMTVKTFEQVEVKVDGCNRLDILKLEDSLILALEQKLNKLNIVVKNFNVYVKDGMILVNDSYNMCPELITLSESLGFKIKKLETSLKGKTYLISDDIVDTLRQFNRDYNFKSKIANKEVDAQVEKIIDENKFNFIVDNKILGMISNIKENGVYLEIAKQEIITNYKDDKFVSRELGDVISNKDSIKEEFLKLSNKTQEMINNTNSKLKEGTSQIIKYRAKQMGYSIEEVRNGNEIQLVLVRCE